jgi:hypothetical protein
MLALRATAWGSFKVALAGGYSRAAARSRIIEVGL